jgi:hypothetical protein
LQLITSRHLNLLTTSRLGLTYHACVVQNTTREGTFTSALLRPPLFASWSLIIPAPCSRDSREGQPCGRALRGRCAIPHRPHRVHLGFSIPGPVVLPGPATTLCCCHIG